MPRARRPDPTDEPVTAEEMQRARPLREAAPDLAAALEAHQRQTRGTQKTPLRVAISLRIEQEALARYRATGRGWQTRMSADLSRAARRLRP
jgi:uncharacterized protein (DUF4415 family)